MYGYHSRGSNFPNIRPITVYIRTLIIFQSLYFGYRTDKSTVKFSYKAVFRAFIFFSVIIKTEAKEQFRYQLFRRSRISFSPKCELYILVYVSTERIVHEISKIIRNKASNKGCLSAFRDQVRRACGFLKVTISKSSKMRIRAPTPFSNVSRTYARPRKVSKRQMSFRLDENV